MTLGVPPASPKRSVGGALTIAVKDATEIWRDGRFRWAARKLPQFPADVRGGRVILQATSARAAWQS